MKLLYLAPTLAIAFSWPFLIAPSSVCAKDLREYSAAPNKESSNKDASQKKVIFSSTDDASNPPTNKYAAGHARETLILATDATGTMKIVSQRGDKLGKRHSDPSERETSEAPGLKEAKAEYEASSHDEVARGRYVTKLAAMLGQGMEYWWRTHDKMGGPNTDGVGQELCKHPVPRTADAKELARLLVGKWLSPRHVYVFRPDGTYGMEESEQRDKWRIEGNEYIDDVSRGPIILLDRNYFIYAEGQGVAFYTRVKE